MRHSRFISSTPLIAGLSIAGLPTGLLFVIMFATIVVPLNAADSDSRYDVSQEVTLSGTVSSVLHKPAPGMTWGSHLMIETASGRLDASLGRFGLEGKGALSVTPGQQIELTGVMKTVRDNIVFVVRKVRAGGETYTIRNQHGIEVSPLTRERAAEKGVTL
jgi:hypothetical protein